MRLIGKWAGVGIVLSALSVAKAAEAQDAGKGASGSAAAASGAPDVVRLKNGGLLRGTISELIPGDSVTIVTAAGKTREFPMAEVAYAGPASGDAAAAAPTVDAAPAPESPKADDEQFGGKEESDKKVRPYVVREGAEAQLHLSSTPEGMTFYRQSGSAVAVGAGGTAVATGYERLCTAPCDISLPAGSEVLALSEGNEPPRVAGPVAFPAGRSELAGRLESNSGIRTAGWVLAVGTLVVGSVMVYSAFGKEEVCSEFTGSCYEETKTSYPLFLGGMLVAGAGVPVGIMLGVRRDSAKVDVVDRNSGAATPAVVPGLTVHGHM